MNGAEPNIEIFKPFGEAFELMKKILFQPFDLKKWFIIGFAAWLANLGRGGGSFNYQFNRREEAQKVNEAISQVKRRITVVRIAVAKFESIAVTPIFARTAVAPAKTAESNDQASQLLIYTACLHWDTRFVFKRLDQGGGVFCSEAKGNGRCEIVFNNAQRRNG